MYSWTSASYLLNKPNSSINPIQIGLHKDDLLLAIARNECGHDEHSDIYLLTADVNELSLRDVNTYIITRKLAEKLRSTHTLPSFLKGQIFSSKQNGMKFSEYSL